MGCRTFLNIYFLQKVGEATDEGCGERMHPTSLSNWATTLLRVRYIS